jgi:hypothetical protein
MILDKAQKEKVLRFLSDKLMSDTVRHVIERSFLKPTKGLSVHELAAARMAIDMLDDAWKDLQKSRSEVERESEVKTNRAL